jgi:3-deoxy-D-manno-octulosonic-acid transferase
VQVIVQDVPLDSYMSMGRFLAHFQPQACILMVRTGRQHSSVAEK